MHIRTQYVAVVALLIGSGVAMASPGLPVTKPPVEPTTSWTGPAIGEIGDPHALAGQWFYNLTTLQYESRPLEFYDNVTGYGGGGAAPDGYTSSLAIYGRVSDMQTDPGSGNIIGFNMYVRITDNRPALTAWVEGDNSHGETTLTRTQDTSPMKGIKLTVEFAVTSPTSIPESWQSPYTQGQTPYIIAENPDELAWYCWTPEHGTPAGGFYVPTYDFGDMPETIGYVDGIIGFTVDQAGIASTDPRYAILMSSYNNGDDLLSNRTTDLKIGDWLDNLALDTGDPYPTDPSRGGNVSVFYTNIPEPASLGLLAIGGLALLRRRS